MKRQQAPPTVDWQQVRLLAKTPEQRTYELMHPAVLIGQPAAAARHGPTIRALRA